MSRRTLAAALLIVVALLALAPGLAGAYTVDDVAREVRCPTCNTPLNVSNSPLANRMRTYIAEHKSQGWSKQQVIDGLVREFGSNVLATPPKSGFDLIAWLVPGLAVLAGLCAIPIITRLWARRRAPAAAVAAPEGEDARRLDEELRRLR
jgi:cytochrome c-type biogenesis protein CcmH